MCHGRTSAKLNRYDSLDSYLNKVYSGVIKNTDEYFQKFTYESFLEIHGMSGYKISDNPLEIYIYIYQKIRKVVLMKYNVYIVFGIKGLVKL